MAHFVYVDDASGDLIDLRIYCSDSCAWSDEFYAGWNGANDVDFETLCESCGRVIEPHQWMVKP